MMSKVTVTTIGGATIDTMFYTDDMMILDNPRDLLRQKLIAFEYGAKIYSDKVFFTYGGGGANAAVCLARLGIKTKTILSVGHDVSGLDIISHLIDQGVNTKLVQVQKQSLTGTSFVVNVGQSKEHVLFAYRGANDKLTLDSQVYRRIKNGWVYLPSLPAGSTKDIDGFLAIARNIVLKLLGIQDKGS